MTKAQSQTSRALKGKKARRRQWISFGRMINYGMHNFTRNAWLSIAATVVMTITLLIFFITLASQHVLTSSVESISETVDMSIYLKTEVSKEQATPMISRIEKLSNTKSVRFISADEARDLNAKENKADEQMLKGIQMAPNRLPATLRITLTDINDTSELKKFVETDTEYKSLRAENKEPSFAGPRRDAIKTIGSWTVLAQQIGLVASVIFVVISSLIIFNTIRMAIFSRKDEIQMMKLIGADKRFIRGPFVVEAVTYGLISAVIATSIGYFALVGVKPGLEGSGIMIAPTIDLINQYLWAVVLSMMTVGAIIGVISSLLATQRYLKI